MKIVLLGAPGSGKGTIATSLVERFGYPHISTGDIFRDNIKRKTPLGIEIEKIIDRGDFCPDEITVEIVKNRLSLPDCADSYILDGFPRNLFQAEQLDKFFSPDMVINLEVEEKTIFHRITGRRVCTDCSASYHTDYIGKRTKCERCGGTLYIRDDDNEEAVKERIAVYNKQTKPLIDYYAKQHKLINVCGEGSGEKVFNDVVKVIGNDNY